MSWSEAEIEAAAQDLLEAERLGAQTGLMSLRHPGLDMTTAYRIQDALVAAKRAEGRRQIGWKIGLTSKAMQDALKIDTPDSGVLFDDMLFAQDASVPKGRFIQPRIEAEIAFLMGADLGPAPSRADVIAATEAVAPALEILDTRIHRKDPVTGQLRIITDTIADNAANAGIVLGEARHSPEIDREGEATTLNNIGHVLDALGDRQGRSTTTTKPSPSTVTSETGKAKPPPSPTSAPCSTGLGIGRGRSTTTTKPSPSAVTSETGQAKPPPSTTSVRCTSGLASSRRRWSIRVRWLELAREIGDRPTEALCEFNVATCCLELGDVAEAVVRLRRAIAIAEECSDPRVDSYRQVLEQIEPQQPGGKQ